MAVQSTDMTLPNTVAVVLYPGCIFFEIALALEVLAAVYAIRFFTPDGSAHIASNGAQVFANGDFDALRNTRHCAVLIPGGDPASILSPIDTIRSALIAQASFGAIVASICAGNLVLAASGLLRGRSGTHNYTEEHTTQECISATRAFWEGIHFVRASSVLDGNFITAQPWAYREYAALLARELGVLSTVDAEALIKYPAKTAYLAT